MNSLNSLGSKEKELLTNVASREVIEYYKRHGFKTKKSIEYYFKYGLKEPIISKKRICNNDDHVAPMEFVSDVLMDIIHDFIVWANRAGSKTYLGGVIAWTKSSFQDKRETNILGGSGEQSEKAYSAMNSFWDITNLGGRYLKQEPLISKTLWNNKSKVSILTASSRSVRGPHPQALLLDEIDEMDMDIYEAALQQPQSKHGISSSTGQLSTNHKHGGCMDKALETALTNPFMKIYKWCIWECLESCRDYECSTCHLSSFCPGDQMKEAEGYYKIEDLVKKLYFISHNSLRVEWFCTKIGRDDMVYGEEFDEDIHVMHRPHDPLLPVYLSFDWGGTNPFTIGVWQYFVDLTAWVRVDEIYQGKTTNQKMLKKAKKKAWWNSIEGGVCDPGRADLKMEWQEAGVPMVGADNDVDKGIEAYKNVLKPVLGSPKIYFHRGCKDSIREFGTYLTKNGKIVKKDDHTKDDERYFIMWKVEKKSGGQVKVHIKEHGQEEKF